VSDLKSKKVDKDKIQIYLGMENVESGTGKAISFQNMKNIDGEAVSFSEGQVLFGKLRPYLQKVWLADREGGCTTEFIVFQPKKKTFPKFLLYRMLSNDFIDKINASSYGAKMPRVSPEFIINMEVNFPSLEEQQRIANFLDHKTSQLDSLITSKQTQINLLSEYKHSLISETVTKGLNPNVKMKDSVVEWIGEIPEHWDSTKLKSVIKEMTAGGTPDSSNDSYWNDESGFPWVAISDMTKSFFIEDTKRKVSEQGLSEKKLKIMPKGTLLYSIFASLGKVAELNVDAVFNQAILGLVPNEKIKKNQLKYWLLFIEKYVDYFASSNTQANLNTEKVKNFPLVLPPIEEQQQIIEFLVQKTTQIDKLVNQIQNEIKKIKEYKQSLIFEAVTGKIEV
jgi:type I restriction enzyme S subunit